MLPCFRNTTLQPRLGFTANWRQIVLLVLVNAFVGAMVGLQRSLVPLLAGEVFGIVSGVLMASFIVAFGLVKAITNLFSGILADRLRRKHVLVAGWLIVLPVPAMLAWGPSWAWIIAANVLLGMHQGLTWSMTVTMKIDLAGARRRGLVMGLNEAAGYASVGLTALLTGYLASIYGLRPEPFYVGFVYALLGLGLSLVFVRDTQSYTQLEASYQTDTIQTRSVRWVIGQTSWRNPTLFAVSQAGFINNLNDGIAWVTFPLLFRLYGLSLEQTSLVIAVYPLVWGVGQLLTGPLSDRIGRKPFIVGGMLAQALGYALIAVAGRAPLGLGLLGSSLLGAGTALVYPVLIAAVGDAAQVQWRATAVGVYRFWRDSGYAVGALLAGVMLGTSLQQATSLLATTYLAAFLTLTAGVVAWYAMRETLSPSPARG